MASLEKPVRFFPIEQVKNDLLFLLNKKAKIIKFLDRSFNVNKGYMLEILKFISEHDNGYTTFQFEVVGDLLTDEECEFINTMRKGYLKDGKNNLPWHGCRNRTIPQYTSYLLRS